MDFIKVTTRDGEAYINPGLIEMIIPKPEGCTLRMSEKLFLQVRESAEEILAMLSAL